jgi:hypothetical protein
MTKDDLIAIIKGVEAVQRARARTGEQNYVAQYATRGCEQLCKDLIEALEHAPADDDRTLLLATAAIVAKPARGSV